MRTKEQIASLLAQFMAAETIEQEEHLLADYFRTATDIPGEWQPYADMFQIFDEGATRLSESELEECASALIPRHKTWRIGRVAASLVIMLCLGAVAATITYHAVVEPKTTSTQSTSSTISISSEEIAHQNEATLPDTLTFKNKTLGEIAQQMSEVFECNVVFADTKIAALRLYLTLPKGSTVERFVETIDAYDTLEATLKGNTITIKRQEEQP